MNIRTAVPLKDYTTMHLGGDAAYMVEVSNESELQEIYQKAASEHGPVFVLGGGSNTIVHDEGFNGYIVLNRIKGFEIKEDTSEYTVLSIGAGEDWDEVVARTVNIGLSGIEALSAIPGTVGGAPVQNIGAYGQEIADVLASVEVYNIPENRFEILSAEALELGYRHSILRGNAAGKYVITRITIRLRKTNPEPPFYAALASYFEVNGITKFTPQIVRDAVIDIRKNKLPDPKLLPNAGSFFKNAIVSTEIFENLQKQYPDVPSYDMPSGTHKIPTGWLIEQAGFKGQILHGIRVHDKNTLVLINESASSYADLATARDTIIQAVQAKFGIVIEQEPLELQPLVKTL